MKFCTLLNAATCWFLAPELSSADGVFKLLHRPSGTLFRHICTRHWLVADSL